MCLSRVRNRSVCAPSLLTPCPAPRGRRCSHPGHPHRAFLGGAVWFWPPLLVNCSRTLLIFLGPPQMSHLLQPPPRPRAVPRHPPILHIYLRYGEGVPWLYPTRPGIPGVEQKCQRRVWVSGGGPTQAWPPGLQETCN